MNFSELVIQRYSVRGYQERPVEQEILEQVLQAARMAPTAANRQPFKLYVIPTAERSEDLRRIYNSNWFVQAPLVIGGVILDDQAWKRQSDNQSYAMVDIAIAFDHLTLAATALGLGTCWIAAFDPQAARQVLRLPESETPVLFTPLGYPDAPARPKRRKTMEELVVYFNA